MSLLSVEEGNKLRSFNDSSEDFLVDDDEQVMALRHNAQAPFVKCNKLLLFDYTKVSPRAKILYLMLKSFVYQQRYEAYQKSKAFEQEEVAWPGRKRLASDMGCSLKTISNLLAELRDKKLITSERRGVGKTWRHRLAVLKRQGKKH